MLIITKIPTGKYIPEKKFKLMMLDFMELFGWDSWTANQNMRWSYNLPKRHRQWLS